MKMSDHVVRAVRSVLGHLTPLALGCALLVAPPGSSIAASAQQPAVGETKVVVLDLAVADQAPIRVAIRDGSSGSLTLEGGRKLELLPTLDGDTLNLDVVEVSVAGDTGQTKRDTLARFRLARGTVARLDVGTVSIDMVWTDVRTAPARRADTDANGCTECCMVCDGVKVCGCVVGSPCGKCCCAECCDIQGAPSATAAGTAQQRTNGDAATCSSPAATQRPAVSKLGAGGRG